MVGAVLPAPDEGAFAGAGETAPRLRGWREEAGSLWLFPVPQTSGLPVRVTCAGAWKPETVPLADEELVLVDAHARCCETLATDTARAMVFYAGDTKFDKTQVSEHYRALAETLRAHFTRELAGR